MIYMFDQLYIYNSDSRGVPIHGRREQHVCLPADRIPYQMVLIIEARSTLLGGQQAKDARFVISNDGRDELADWSPHPVILIDAC